MWFYETSYGTFSIRRREDGRYVCFFEDEALESHESPQACAYALGSGTCTWPSVGDPSLLGVPEELSAWRRARS